MAIEITEEQIGEALQQIRQSPVPLAARQLAGDDEANLLIIRELRRRGLVDGVFLNDSTRPGDQYGPFLYDAARLTAT